MSSTITAGNATNGLAISSDNTGQLEIKTGTGAGTTALTLSSSQAATFAGAVTSSGLVTGATGALYPIVQSTSQATTSGTAIQFTDIPSWVRRITLMFNGVSTSGTSNVIVQLGYGATPTYVTSGYLGNATQFGGGTSTNYTSGFLVVVNASATAVVHGSAIFSSFGGNVWTCQASLGRSDTTNGVTSAGSVPVANQITAIRLTTAGGTDTFDAGSINILYE